MIIFRHSKFPKKISSDVNQSPPTKKHSNWEENCFFFSWTQGSNIFLSFFEKIKIERIKISIDSQEGNPFAISLWFRVSHLLKTDFTNVDKRNYLNWSNTLFQPRQQQRKRKKDKQVSFFFFIQRASKIPNWCFKFINDLLCLLKFKLKSVRCVFVCARVVVVIVTLKRR